MKIVLVQKWLKRNFSNIGFLSLLEQTHKNFMKICKMKEA